jgi:hypothetical protein
VKRSGRDEPIWVVIHICMETTQSSLYSYLYLKLAKKPCFSFFFYKIGEQEGRTGSAMRWVAGGGRRRREVVQIMYTYN